ncbi:MAG: sulfite exporter TauE/SafE family protein [Humidesulfovibrio sp.]|nr:sulfite exporter TauE/SafE family protein [Humidesulfovibrio sp.]
MEIWQLLIVGIAAVFGGAVNALAGGGTLITFPVLTAVGVPIVAANITNTVALCPGYLGATLAQLKDLRGQRLRMLLLLPVGVLGGLGGGVLLLHTEDQMFHKVVPYLIFMAVILMAQQDRIRAWLMRSAGKGEGGSLHDAWSILPVLPAAIYGGFFGAGVSVIIIAVLGLIIADSLTRLNALKQALSLVINIAAGVFFLFSGQVVWPAALVMAVGAIAGGVLGGRMAGRIRPLVLRRIVIVIGTIVGIFYLVR